MPDKLSKTVGVPLTDDQYDELRNIIKNNAPNMPEGKLIRLAWIYFLRQTRERGLLHVLGEILGA